MVDVVDSVNFDVATPAEEVAAFVDRIKVNPQLECAEALVTLLAERHPVYRNKSTKTVARVRGYIMASFESTGLPSGALSYVLDALETSTNPYLVAAAAKALRGASTPDGQFAERLLMSVYNIWQHDEPISFVDYHLSWPLEYFETAVTEVFATLVWLGPAAQTVRQELVYLHEKQGHRLRPEARAMLVLMLNAIPPLESKKSCCGGSTVSVTQSFSEVKDVSVLGDCIVEDQDGVQLKWNTFFQEKVSIVAFFYTRCANPRKCTQTIYNIVDLQLMLEEIGLSDQVRTAAITYDPMYDTARTLRSYGESRQFRFGINNRMFRVPEAFEEVEQAFKLGVNYTGSQVNQHRVELFILDAKGAVVKSFLRVQFDPQKVLDEVMHLFERESFEQPSKANQRSN